MLFRIRLSVLAWFMATAPLLMADEHDNRGRGFVTFYEHANFRGASITLRAGDALSNLSDEVLNSGVNANDRITSIQIEGGAVVFVYQDAGFRGGALRLTQSVRNLDDFAPGWNDHISSIRVERNRGGPDGRPDPRAIDRAERMIERAYREILRRDPDANELKVHSGHVLEEGWDEEQLRHALWTSDEYREVVMRFIVNTYRELLGRDPDNGGARLYRDRMIRDRWTEEQVRASIRSSDEYRRKHP